MTAERPQLLCVPLLPELGRAGLSQTQRAGMSFRPSMMELILCTLSLSHSVSHSVSHSERERERETQGYCLCSCRAVGLGWISTAFKRTWLTLCDIKLCLMGFAYIQLPAAHNTGDFAVVYQTAS